MAAGSLFDCQGSPYMKNEYNFFHRKLNDEYFLFNNFFEKKQYFLRKPWKTVLETDLTIFYGKRRLPPKINITFLSQMRYWILYYLTVFSKKAIITLHRQILVQDRPCPKLSIFNLSFSFTFFLYFSYKFVLPVSIRLSATG